MGPSKVIQHMLTTFYWMIQRWLLWLMPSMDEDLYVLGVAQSVGLASRKPLGWPAQILYWPPKGHLAFP